MGAPYQLPWPSLQTRDTGPMMGGRSASIRDDELTSTCRWVECFVTVGTYPRVVSEQPKLTQSNYTSVSVTYFAYGYVEHPKVT